MMIFLPNLRLLTDLLDVTSISTKRIISQHPIEHKLQFNNYTYYTSCWPNTKILQSLRTQLFWTKNPWKSNAITTKKIVVNNGPTADTGESVWKVSSQPFGAKSKTKNTQPSQQNLKQPQFSDWILEKICFLYVTNSNSPFCRAGTSCSFMVNTTTRKKSKEMNSFKVIALLSLNFLLFLVVWQFQSRDVTDVLAGHHWPAFSIHTNAHLRIQEVTAPVHSRTLLYPILVFFSQPQPQTLFERKKLQRKNL